MDFAELRTLAWEKYLETVDELDKIAKMYRTANTKRDLLRAKLLSDLCERKVRILDRILMRTDPLRAVVQNLTYRDVVHIVGGEKKKLAGGEK